MWLLLVPVAVGNTVVSFRPVRSFARFAYASVPWGKTSLATVKYFLPDVQEPILRFSICAHRCDFCDAADASVTPRAEYD